jgi:hypothetical protein
MNAHPVRDVIAGVQLNDVRLKESSAKTRVRGVRDIRNAKVSTSHGTKIIGRSEHEFIVGARMVVRVDASDTAGEPDPPVSVDVTIALTYSLSDAHSVAHEVLEEFARVNGAFNAWPYWREYVQATLSRMNLPPLVLPVFRVVPTAESEQRAIEATATIAPPDSPPPSRTRARKPLRKKRTAVKV